MRMLRKLGRLIVGMMPRVAYPVIVGPLRGFRFILGSLAGEGGGATVYFNQVEIDQTIALVKFLRPADVFFDIGANVGYYTLLASKLVGAEGFVCAFEPLVRNIYYLHRHVNLNHLYNVLIVAAACADTSNIARFSFGKNTAEGRVVTTPKTHNIDFKETSVVPVVTVDAVCSLLSVQPNVLKIDVEGAELAVLLGAQKTLRNARPRIFLSIHSDELRTSCLAFLKDLGYRIEPLGANTSNPTEFMAHSDSIQNPCVLQ